MQSTLITLHRKYNTKAKLPSSNRISYFDEECISKNLIKLLALNFFVCNINVTKLRTILRLENIPLVSKSIKITLTTVSLLSSRETSKKMKDINLIKKVVTKTKQMQQKQ